MADWNEYFSKTRPPSNLDEAKRTIQDFAVKHRQLGRNIVLVTSGGTTVPIESNTVRFVDNFSQGTRGACSAEYFLMQGYAVVFLHRQRSYEPFCRHFEGHNALDLLELQVDGNGGCRVAVDESRAPGLQDIVRKYKEVQNGCLLLKIGFMTLSDYLFLLRASAEALSLLGTNVMFYLAAAVSDFYIPEPQMAEHKIQSSEGNFTLNMSATPKMLSPLVKEWAKSAFVVSFKLETDVNIISRKAREALQKYNHQVVIANILQTRRKTVVLVTPFDEVPIWMSDHELEMGKEIEEKIVAELTRRHFSITSGGSDGTHPQQAVNNNVAFTPQHYQTQTSIPSNLTQHSAVPTSMPGLAPIVYQPSPTVAAKTGLPNVLLHLKSTGDTSEVSAADVMSSTLLKRSISAKEDSGGLSFEMQEFIREFKTRRVNLGYTQDDVGKELSELKGPTYSQSFISRFEGKQLGMKAAERMKPILESWIQSKEEEAHGGAKLTKKRRKRTSFSPEYINLLNEQFEKNPKPTLEEMQVIANKLELDLTTVKVWFCNKKQSLKRIGGQPLQRQTLRADIEAKRRKKSDDLTDVFQNHIKTLTPTGTVAMPFFISHHEGNTIPIASVVSSVSSATHNTTQVATTIPPSTLQQQQIVHLSQLPIYTSMAVVNNGGMTSSGTTVDSTNAHLLPNGRIIHSGSVLQLPTGSIPQQHLHQTNSSLSDATVIISPSEGLNTSVNSINNGASSAEQMSIISTASTKSNLNTSLVDDGSRNSTPSDVLDSNDMNIKSRVVSPTKHINILGRTVIERNVLVNGPNKNDED